jgi:hypothetical protein
MVFHHRKASLHELPLLFDQEALDLLQGKWLLYHRELTVRRALPQIPKTIGKLIDMINEWLHKNTKLCHQ